MTTAAVIELATPVGEAITALGFRAAHRTPASEDTLVAIRPDERMVRAISLI